MIEGKGQPKLMLYKPSNRYRYICWDLLDWFLALFDLQRLGSH